MSFELRVEFSGLCLYVVHSDKKQVAVLMPDARKAVIRTHDDGESGEPHVGYVRFDLANLDVGNLQVPAGDLPARDSGNPPYELIHKFSAQTLDFGLGSSTEPITAKLAVPVFDEFATTVKPKGNLFGATPPADLLMRTVITGGSIEGLPSGDIWELSSVLTPGATTSYKGAFAGFTMWTRTVEADGLSITIANFDGSAKTTIPLKPVTINGKQTIAMKVANLCAHNPLEWDEFEFRESTRRDVDFKWLYRVTEPTGKTFQKALLGAEFPFPRADATQGMGLEDCMGGSISADFP